MPPIILTLVDHYLPGMKAGGPVRSIAHIVERLGGAYRFLVATRDRDFGDVGPYPGVPTETWLPVGGAFAMYLAPDRTSLRGIRRVLRETEHDLLYLNSLFSARMTFAPLLLRRLRVVARRPVVVAPRGELHRGALATGTWWGLLPGRLAAELVTPRFMKKWLYIHACRVLGLFEGVVWQASSDAEAKDVRRWIGRGARVFVASDVPAVPPPLPAPRAKEPGLLRLAFVSRIAPKKNLAGALRFLRGVRARVEFDVYGPIGDPAYWDECRRLAAALPPNVHVRYHGALDHPGVTRVLDHHELMILPTWGENFGHVILEALVSGCPVLVSDQTPWRGLEAAGAGWDLPLTSPAAFTRVLEAVAAMDADEHARWSRRAAEYGRRWAADDTPAETTRALFELALEPAGQDAQLPSPAARVQVSPASASVPERP